MSGPSAQFIGRRVGVGMVLEIGDVLQPVVLWIHVSSRGFVLFAAPFYGQRSQLLVDASGKVPGTALRAEGAAARTFAAVPVGAGKACVKRKLYHFAAEAFLKIRGYGIVVQSVEHILIISQETAALCFQLRRSHTRTADHDH